MGHLIRSFILANHEQLCALLTPVPARGLLIASAVLDLYWIALHSSSAGTKLSIPTCVASAALFGNGRRDSMPLVSAFIKPDCLLASGLEILSEVGLVSRKEHFYRGKWII